MGMQEKADLIDISEWYGAIWDCIDQIYKTFPPMLHTEYSAKSSIGNDARRRYFLHVTQELEKANYSFRPILTFINDIKKTKR